MKTWQKIRENPSLIEKYLLREKVVDTIRAFFKGQGFHEINTPILVPIPSAEPNLEVFETQLRTASGIKKRAFLIMSPEYSCKKLLTAGLGNIFEITRSFRNEEEVSPNHNPEFTMLEWYRVGSDYKKIMEDFEKLFIRIVSSARLDIDLSHFRYQGEEYNLTEPWPKMSVAECFKQYSGIDTETLLSPALLSETAVRKGYTVNNETTWEQIFYQIFFNEIEPKLKEIRRPIFIYDYPASQAALSRKKKDDPRFAERFEIFLAGIELGNCFSELTNHQEQKERFEKDLAERKKFGKTDYPIDNDLISALETGMPETAGIAVGVDRLIMLAADTDKIADTLFFPADELFEL